MNKNTHLSVRIDGRQFDISAEEWENLDCIQVNDHTYHVIEDGKTYTINVLESDKEYKNITVRTDGENKTLIVADDLELLIERMGLNATRSKKQRILLAPMPGLVTSIKAEAGQEVDEGTPILILEAMKMENVIAAPHHAIIKEVKVKAGQAIEKGAPLVEFSED